MSDIDASAAPPPSVLLASGLWSTAARTVPQLYTIVITFAAARYLGADGLGRQSFIAFVELSVVMLLTGGLPMALMRYIGESVGHGETGAVKRLLRWAWAVETVVALAGGGILVVAPALGAEPGAAWVLAGVAAALGILHTVPSALLIGMQRWRDASIVGLTTGAFATAAAVAVLAAGGGITGMFAVEAVISVVNLVWTSALARKVGGDLLTQHADAAARDLRRPVTRYALVASIGVVFTFVVWRRSEFFFLERFSSYTQIALYSVSFSLVTALVRVFDAVGAVVTPAVATLYGAGANERIRAGYGRALRLLVLGTIPIAAVAMALATPALRLLGHEFAAATSVIAIMLATFPLVPLVKTSNGLLHGLGRVQFVVAVGGFAALVDVVGCLLLVPRFDADGAALANGAAQLASAIPVLVYCHRLVGSVEWDVAAIVKSATTAVAAAAAAIAVRPVGGDVVDLLLGTAAAFAVFAATATLLRLIPAGDAAWLVSAVGDRGRGVFARAFRVLAANPR